MERFFEIDNPHWFGEKDEDIEKWRSQGIKWFPKWIEEISLEPFSLNFIIGPRRVGKTTGIKLLIKKLIEEGVNPKEIVYFDAEISSTLDLFRNAMYWIVSNNFKYIFLDEVTSLENWWKVVKFFIDSGRVKNNILIVSGSSSIKAKRQTELFPGRTGKGKKIEVLPLSFLEYYFLFHKKVKIEYLEKRFKEYLEKGGFPESINKGKVFAKDLIASLESEILKMRLSIKITSEIIGSLLKKIPSAVSYQSIASDIGIDHKTVRHYLEVLEEMYLLKIAYWRHNSQVSFRKEKKIFFRDPFIYQALSLWTRKKFLESALYEGIVQEYLFRRFGEIYYYRNRYEVDAIADKLKVEVKAGKPHRNYPKNVIVLEEDSLPAFFVKVAEKLINKDSSTL